MRLGALQLTLGSVLGLVVTSWPMEAHAAPFELAWSAPEGCPSREAIVEATQTRLGEPASGSSPELFVQGTVETVSRGFVVILALRDASGRSIGERQVRVERQDCKDVEDPASVVLAMMIAVARPTPGKDDASQKELEATPPPPASEPRASTPPPPATQPAAPRIAPPSLPAHRVLLSASGVTSLGILDTVGLGFGVRASYSPTSPLHLALETAFEASPKRQLAGGEVAFQLASASARVGLTVLRTATVELIPTAGARGALIRASPTGFATVQDEVRTTMLVGPGLLVRAKLGPHLFAEVLPEVEGALRRDRFKIRDGGKLYDVHRAAAFEARLSLGLAYELR